MKNLIQRFAGDERGTVSLEFVIVFPVFFTFVLMTYESGIVSARQVMLEHGVDKTVRAVRTGVISNPTPANLRASICTNARILPKCVEQIEVELLIRDPLAWTAIPTQYACIDRGAATQPTYTIDETGNNLLMFLRACIRIDPFLPTSGLGKAIVDANNTTEADGSYALATTGAFVVEPFRAVAEGGS